MCGELQRRDVGRGLRGRRRWRARCAAPRAPRRNERGCRRFVARRLRAGCRRRCARPLHAHVERRVVAQREAARGLVELHRGHADVEDDAVERRGAEAARRSRRDRRSALRPAVSRPREAATSCWPAAIARGIAIDGDDARAALDAARANSRRRRRCRRDRRRRRARSAPPALRRAARECGGPVRRRRLIFAPRPAIIPVLRSRRLAPPGRRTRSEDGARETWPPRDAPRTGPAPKSETCGRGRRTPLRRVSPSEARILSLSRMRPSESARRTSLVPNSAVARSSRSCE